jgi:hypothetical protein
VRCWFANSASAPAETRGHLLRFLSGGRPFPVEAVLQDRGLAARRPGAHPMRPLAQPALVGKQQRAGHFQGFFLRRGQIFFFQWAICFSLRSRARPVGRCGLQPKRTKIFQMWPS